MLLPRAFVCALAGAAFLVEHTWHVEADEQQRLDSLRADLAAQGKPIGPHDILIAATARAHDAVLVTHNTGEFARVTGLRLEDWEA